MVTKTVRVKTTTQQRQQIVAMATKEPTWSHAALANWATAQFKLGLPIDRKTISKTLKRANKISSISGYHLKRSRTTSTPFPEVEAALLCWIDKINASKMSLTQSMVREEASRIAQRQQIDLSSLIFFNG
uniref:AlNc14C277G10053 protein n=1 Tax=Albugo laibachii Nc14 TaxID=890382 RepID=F0WUP5_9STRA|nr:AlNc14C277G10053 [Albugo laibachii Nc14]CCA25761.1 AlNc14C320G10574 [Albugo laibachii Nc14]|eukprot:CCA25761.1 AlNc14C320G10574 [Albugo laibachii Nc14]